MVAQLAERGANNANPGQAEELDLELVSIHKSQILHIVHSH